MSVQPVRHVSIGIARPFREVYDFLAEPGNFPRWASGLGSSLRHVDGMTWLVETPEGPMRVRFCERNSFGVLDHSLLPEGGDPMHNPFRVVANGDGSEVTFTLFQRPGMSDAQFDRDAEWVASDLRRLKTLIETGAS